MKTLTKTNLLLFVGIILTVFLSFTIIQTNQKQELIIGTWINEDNPNWKMVFNFENKCFEYYEGETPETYSFIISSEESTSGLTHFFLDLVNLQNSDDTYTYSINTLNEERLVLIYLDSPMQKLITFIRQE